jgi:microcystin-dependent protein
VQWQCVTVPQPTLPTCNQTQAVTWNNGTWGCAPLPAPYPVPPGNCAAGVTWNSATSSWACLDSDSIIPPGTVIAYAGDVVNPPPTGWLWCNGDPFPTSQPYTALFNVIGTTYGSAAGNPPGFRVPDYRGYFLRGFDATGNIDPGPRVALTSGAIPGTGSIEAQDIKSHTHAFAANVYGSMAMGLADSMLGIPSGSGQVFLQSATAATGGLETRPANIAVNYLIKY